MEVHIDDIVGKHLLIDGDIIRYRCGFACEKKEYIVAKSEGTWIKAEDKSQAKRIRDTVEGTIFERTDLKPVGDAIFYTDMAMAGIIEKTRPTGYTVYLSGKRNFRFQIAVTEPYKGNRGPKPIHYEAIGEHLIGQYNAQITDGIEADDAIGRDLSELPDGRVCVSIDKDLDQISGWHYNWVKGNAYWVTPKEGDFTFYTQLLTGDPTDNVPGIRGMGPAGASKILEGASSRAELCKRAWTVYRGEFNNSQSARSFFLEQAQLLWILRKGPAGGQFTCPIDLKD